MVKRKAKTKPQPSKTYAQGRADMLDEVITIIKGCYRDRGHDAITSDWHALSPEQIGDLLEKRFK